VRPLLALAEGVEAVAEFAGGLGLVPELGDQDGRGGFADREDADELMDGLPVGEPLVGGGVPVGGRAIAP
jgi:hypothetical protein